MKISLYYKEENIKWNVIGADEYKVLKNSLDPNKFMPLHTNNLKIGVFKKGNWVSYTSSYSHDIMYIVVHEGKQISGYTCKVNVAHVDKNASHKATPALKTVKDEFKAITNESFKTCFGTVEENILRCIPKQFYWSKKSRYLGSANSVDFSSHYPAAACSILPDSHTAITKKGTVAPTAEYPFAFYIKSGHIAIYNELDTHLWLANRFGKRTLFRLKTVRKHFDDTFKDIPLNEDITILMKPAKYTLAEVYNKLYNARKDDEDAKLFLVASIGQMHRKNYVRDKYAHLAAVIIARANKRMIDLVSKLDLSEIIQIQVDGVIYTGDKKIGIDTKYLGAPVQEAYHQPCRWDRIGVYMLKLNNGKMKIKYQGYQSMTDGRDIEDSTKFEDMDLWVLKGE